MPVSPSCVSGISARHFRNCRSFDELWIFRVGPAAFKYRTGRKIRNPTIPSTSEACLFFSNPFSEFCFSTPEKSFFSRTEFSIILEIMLPVENNRGYIIDIITAHVPQAGQHVWLSPGARDISRFSPRINRIFPWKALNPFFGAQDEGFGKFHSR